jgi:hypothetical protein
MGRTSSRDAGRTTLATERNATRRRRGAAARGARRAVALGFAAAGAVLLRGGALAGGATYRHVVVTAPATLTASWKPVAWVRGRPAAWLAQRPGATAMRLDQRYVHLDLHAGFSDGGVAGWTYGDRITPREIHLVIAAFNGGFKLSYTNVGFMSNGHVAVPLKPGLASIVTYADGTTNIAAWHNGVPDRRKKVFSVLQNQSLLIDRGRIASNVNSCVIVCWGDTIQGLMSVPRSGLGIDAKGRLVWAAGELFSPAGLASTLAGIGAVRAIELDINPYAVAGYLYVHHASGPTAVAIVRGMVGILGQYLSIYGRDFFTVVAN